MKATDLTKEYRKAQKISVESPRFIKTLERALEKLFTEADKGKQDELTYAQFYDAFKLLPTYDLNENDILADYAINVFDDKLNPEAA